MALPSLGVIDRFVYLDFDELRILPDFGSAEPTVADRVSFHLSARLLFIVAAALRVLYEFWRVKSAGRLPIKCVTIILYGVYSYPEGVFPENNSRRPILWLSIRFKV